MKSHSKLGFRQMPEPPTPCILSHHGSPGNSSAAFSLLGAEAPGKSQLHSPAWGLWGPVAVGCCDAHRLPTRPALRPSHCGDSESQADGQPWIQILWSQFLVGGASKDIPRPATGCLEIAADPGSWEAALLGNR